MARLIVLPKVAPGQWNQLLALPILCGEGLAAPLPREQFRPDVAVGWTDTAIVAGFDVVDNDLRESDNPDQIYSGDSVELLVGSGDAADRFVQVVATPDGKVQTID